MIKINNRRYIGCKTKLLDNIYDVVAQYNFSEGSVFADIFAGTGVVANMFAQNGYRTILNDTLYSNTVVYNAILSDEEIRNDFIAKTIEYLNSIDEYALEENYFSSVYGGKYFEQSDAKKIGFIRDYIEDNKGEFSHREYCYLVSSLLYACDKIANTVGHFESYLLREPIKKGVTLKEFELHEIKYPAQIFNTDANALAGSIKPDIVYIDPPYNARQYVNFYHVLENLARWNKPTEFEGKSMKFKRNELKSDYCRSKAPQLFEQLIESLDCSLIIASYNNTYTAGSISSVNTISEEQIKSILEKKGRLTIKEFDYKAFNSGKTNLKNHKEYLYICEVLR